MLAFQLLMLRLPGSPRWLVKQKDLDAARAVLERVRPDDFHTAPELDRIVALEGRKQETSRRNRGWSGLRQGWVRPALGPQPDRAVFVWRKMPELTRHSLEDIEEHLQDDKFSPADLQRA